MKSAGHVYHDNLRALFRKYRTKTFPGADDLFEDRGNSDTEPTVFRRMHASRNVLMPPGATPDLEADIAESISAADRHKWFGSMGSSQALCQSVFAGLKGMGRLSVLEGLVAEDGNLAFYDRTGDVQLTLEYKVSNLGETLRQTSVDAYFSGAQRVAVEVKFGEAGYGTCSRPRLKPTDANYHRDHCDGNFVSQRGREDRCSLTSQGVKYWKYIPQIFNWSADVDQFPCPLAPAYQLARNILAACVNEDGTLEFSRAHALVVYDDRNPAFALGGGADVQWTAAVATLRFPHMLRKVSWQRLVGHLAAWGDLRWLVEDLQHKYGMVGSSVET
jgi:hypothetical protein